MLRDAFSEGRLPCLPSLAAMPAVPAGPAASHSGSVLEHAGRVMDAVAGDSLAVWMAFVHDAGKLETPPEILPHHYGHEARGAVLAQAWCKALDLPGAMVACGCMAAREHMKAGRYRLIRPGTRYDLILAVARHGQAAMAAFWKLADADSKSDVSRQALADWARVKAFLDLHSGDGEAAGCADACRLKERLRQQGIRVLMAGHKAVAQC